MSATATDLTALASRASDLGAGEQARAAAAARGALLTAAADLSRVDRRPAAAAARSFGLTRSNSSALSFSRVVRATDEGRIEREKQHCARGVRRGDRSHAHAGGLEAGLVRACVCVGECACNGGAAPPLRHIYGPQEICRGRRVLISISARPAFLPPPVKARVRLIQRRVRGQPELFACSLARVTSSRRIILSATLIHL